MPLISCPECKSQVSDQAAVCIHCGFPILKKTDEANVLASSKRLLEGNPNYSNASRSQGSSNDFPSEPRVFKTAKSRGVYIILGLFLGMFGIHNFYAGYIGRGAVQLLLVLILGWFVIGLVVVAPWVIYEMFTVRKDAAGDLLV